MKKQPEKFPVQVQFEPTFPGWIWIVQTPDGEEKSLTYFASKAEAMEDGLDMYRLAQHQHQAMKIMGSAFVIAREQGLSNYDIIQGFASYTFASTDPDLVNATGNLERAAYATMGETSLLDAPESMENLIERLAGDQ